MEKKTKKTKSRKTKEISNASLIKLPPIEKEDSYDKETKNQNNNYPKRSLIVDSIKYTNEVNNDNNNTEKVIINFTNCIFFSQYKVTKKISEGNFSKIYQVIEINTDEKYACKIESKRAKQPMLDYEYKIMDYLSIKKLEVFSIHTTAMIAYQIINILQYIHIRGIIHRDIKPGNFVMGLGLNNLNLYIIDFGFAKKYKSMSKNKIYSLTENHELTGTSRYSSINAMKGLQQSCRDDLESLAYMLYFFLNGKLPWMGFKEKNKELLDKKILEKKIETMNEILGKDLPIQFCEFLSYAKNLKYDETPDYNLLKGKMMEVICLGGQSFDKIYDWTDKNKLEEEESEEDDITEKVETTCCKM